jgi:hypothetical protein
LNERTITIGSSVNVIVRISWAIHAVTLHRDPQVTFVSEYSVARPARHIPRDVYGDVVEWVRIRCLDPAANGRIRMSPLQQSFGRQLGTDARGRGAHAVERRGDGGVLHRVAERQPEQRHRGPFAVAYGRLQSASDFIVTAAEGGELHAPRLAGAQMRRTLRAGRTVDACNQLLRARMRCACCTASSVRPRATSMTPR